MMKTGNTFGLSVLVLRKRVWGSPHWPRRVRLRRSRRRTSCRDHLAQARMNADDKATYATGKPLETQSKEGFWGQMNPLARKKWVHRQVDPIKDRYERTGSAAGQEC